MYFKEAIKNLQNKGFVESKSQDHVYLRYQDCEGKIRSLSFHYSHSDKPNDPIPDFYFLTAKKSLKLNDKKEVIKLFDCSMSRIEYEQKTCK